MKNTPRFSIVPTLLLGLGLEASAKLYVLVTPEGTLAKGRKIFCRIEPDGNPPAVKNDLVRFKATVGGTRSPIRWRVPLFSGRNGDNHLQVTRVGSETPTDGVFFIDLNVKDLQMAEASETIQLQVQSREGFSTTCSTPAQPVLAAVRQLPPKDLTIINGAITR